MKITSFICNTNDNVDDVNRVLRLMISYYNAIMDENNMYEDVFKKVHAIDKKVIIDINHSNPIPHVLAEMIADKFDAKEIKE